jgi:hypothetical protein
MLKLEDFRFEFLSHCRRLSVALTANIALLKECPFLRFAIYKHPTPLE